jgi:hypothetical protein
MAAHAKYALRCPGISQVLNLPLTVSTAEAGGTEGLVAGENSQVFDLVTASAAAVCTVVANEGAIAEQEEVRIGVEKRAASVASEAVQMPSISG